MTPRFTPSQGQAVWQAYEILAPMPEHAEIANELRRLYTQGQCLPPEGSEPTMTPRITAQQCEAVWDAAEILSEHEETREMASTLFSLHAEAERIDPNQQGVADPRIGLSEEDRQELTELANHAVFMATALAGSPSSDAELVGRWDRRATLLRRLLGDKPTNA